MGHNLSVSVAKDVILLSVKIIPLLLAAIAGLTMALQGTLNSLLSKTIGLLETTFWIQLVGTVLSAILLFVFRLGSGDLGALGKAPWYASLGGLLGVVITFFVASSISKIGATAATTAIVVSQVATACLLDHFGLLGLHQSPLTFGHGIGVVLLAVGTYLLLR